jgi:hypothetical protein
VPGRLPNFGTGAFLFGKHAQQSAMQLAVGSISNYTSQLIGSSRSSPQDAAKALGIGNTGTGKFIGTYNFGASIGTYNFGTESWVSTAQSTPATTKRRLRRRIIRKGNITIYKPKLSVMGGGLVIFPLLFFGLTLPLIIEGAPVPLEQLLGLATFWLLCIALTVVPLGARLEVGEDYIKSYLFGFTTTPKIHRSDVDQIRYENLTAWGISLGKGIKIWRKDAGRSQFSIKPKWAFDASIGESAYGKEAIDHARRVLSSGNQD